MVNRAEKKFQEHISSFLMTEHGYTILENDDMADREHYFCEEHLVAFIKFTQPDAFKSLEEDYGADAPTEIIRALKEEIKYSPLWLVIRDGLEVRNLRFNLYYPKPRSSESVANKYYKENRITFKDEFVIDGNFRIDLVIYLNGLPIITIELKHENNQNVHDAVSQYAGRNYEDKIFKLPFLHIAADTSDVMVATNPETEENFRWYNTGLTNKNNTKGEYPVEYLYRDVLSMDSILEMISFFLIYVPRQESTEDRIELPDYTIFPRYHQSRMVKSVASDVQKMFSDKGELGGKYLVNHSAGSGKTLSISWLADRLHSLYKTGTDEKAINMIFIVTDRRSLDKNIKDELTNFAHLKNIIHYAKNADDLRRHINSRAQIIVTTQQKFKYIMEKISEDHDLKKLKIAFLIDEAHRSQEGKNAAAIRVPFRNVDEADNVDSEEDSQDSQNEIDEIISSYAGNQIFVAFTATPSNATVQLFGDAFDTYSEAEAIEEGYILDVATSIISYSTLYNLHSPIIAKLEKETLFPKGVISKALKNLAYQDKGLIQYKAEIMLRIFEEYIEPLINGRAKAMIVATSRMSGLFYYKIIKEKLKEKKIDCKVLYAFSDFVHPDTNQTVRESELNGLEKGELIEDRFKGEDYRIMVVASKFQTGFNVPLLTGMFLDKALFDRNAVQTLSRLNRCYENKDKVVVVDFTNNANEIIKAFNKYRKGSPYEGVEPDKFLCEKIYDEVLGYNLFDDTDADSYIKKIDEVDSDALLMAEVVKWRERFNEELGLLDDRKGYVHLLSKYVKSYNFLSSFFDYPEFLTSFAKFADFIGPKLIKFGKESDLIASIKNIKVSKASVRFEGVKEFTPKGIKTKRKGKGGTRAQEKATIQDVINQIKEKFDITDEEAIYIREVCEEKISDKEIIGNIYTHRDDRNYLDNDFSLLLNSSIKDSYRDRGLYEQLADAKYTDRGSIFDIMTYTVIESGLE